MQPGDPDSGNPPVGGDDGGTLPGTDSGAGGDDAGGGGGDGPTVDRTDNKLRDFAFTPGAIDSACNERCDEDEYALLDTRVAPQGKLVIFLLGGDNAASNWREHGRVLASFGFHVAIPAYHNYVIDDGNLGDAKTRWEILTGEDVSTKISIARRDSAEGHVIAMIKKLMTTDPGGDWGYYVNGDDTLKYDKVIIAGISQGAANAAVYGRKVHVARAIMHSGGWNTWSGWLSGPPATPAEDQYVFVHTDDGYGSPSDLSVFTSIGILGSATSIDGASPPYGGAHILTTSAPSGYPHVATVANSNSPKQGGVWQFDPAWRYLYGAN